MGWLKAELFLFSVGARTRAITGEPCDLCGPDKEVETGLDLARFPKHA